MNSNLPPIKVFAGESSRYLGESICKELGIELGKMNKERFADGEFEVGLRNRFVAVRSILCSLHSPTVTILWSSCS